MMPHQQFLSHLQPYVESSSRSDSLQTLRELSWKRLQEVGLPTKSLSAFRFVSLRDLYARAFSPVKNRGAEKACFQEAILPECLHSHLVFVDGSFSQALTDLSGFSKELVVSSIEEGMRSHGSFLKKALNRSIAEGTDPFALLNLSLNQDGVFFYVPPGITTEIPLQIIHLSTGSAPQILAPRLQVVMGAQSCLSCISTSYQLHPMVSHLSVPVLEVMLEEGAYFHISNCHSSSWIMESIYGSVKRKAQLQSVSVLPSSLLARQSYHIELKEEEAQVDLSGLSLLKGSHTAHSHVIIEHQAPHTRSMQLFKGVLEGTSRSTFSGKIYVHPVAQKTEAYQLNKTLLLSPHATAISEPNLEIGADDVKASHGSTISQLDEKQLFYFNARGIDQTAASQLLIEGFCKEILQKTLHKISCFR